MRLQLADGLDLPLEAVTETFALLAVRGAGKTNAARVMAEEMFAAKLPFVAVDPVGSWYGLRAGRDGGPGLSIPIFGGRHGDLPLERQAGQLVADLVVDQRLSCVLDLSTFESEGSKKAFLVDFARELYARNEEPLHLFLEEADDYLPQRPMRDELQLLRAWENIVRRGRARGLGITLITQRSASVNKSVLTQTGTLIALRTTSPQDRAAVEDWLKYHAQAHEVLESLPSLEAGEAWVWSPQFLKTTTRVRFRMSRTLDSGATPKAGRAARAPATMADVDLGAIRTRMAETIERAKADDPRELRKRILELERQLAARPSAAPAERIEVPVLEEKTIRRLAAAARVVGMRSGAALRHAEKAHEAAEIVRSVHAEIQTALGRLNNRPTGPIMVAHHFGPNATPETKRALAELGRAAVAQFKSGQPARPGAPSEAVGRGGLQRMLVALAQRPQGLSAHQLGVRAGLSSKSGTFDTYLARGRQAGWIFGDRTRLAITEPGRGALGTYEPLPEGQALLEHWLRELGGGGASRMLRALAEAYPRALTREALAEASGLTGNSGTFDTYLARLRSLELASGKREILASHEFFE